MPGSYHNMMNYKKLAIITTYIFNLIFHVHFHLESTQTHSQVHFHFPFAQSNLIAQVFFFWTLS